ncbi:hypothetical protein ASE86_11025 [Sphingomonas sp. Leaf33]|uniref:hypothetical protein n=1 Tax=Sphingomonas sp. Leaf33 TaxID=1736215 RepID=UPI0006F3D50A|nr:hypothetical protein [Sphingomonas sp. Leaf33]KQN26603.1 hypothetical protein ASE86_11025 [Sphingomonas sp. Leaf33]
MIARLIVPVVLIAALASCPRQAPLIRATDAPDLETAAILRGLVRDPADRDIVGLYARDTDRVCIVRRDGGYRIGATVDYGEGQGCSAAGDASRLGDALRVRLGNDCHFDAAFDGDRITFPAVLPEACATACVRSGTLAALDAERLSESVAEAATMRNADGRAPCAGS